MLRASLCAWISRMQRVFKKFYVIFLFFLFSMNRSWLATVTLWKYQEWQHNIAHAYSVINAWLSLSVFGAWFSVLFLRLVSVYNVGDVYCICACVYLLFFSIFPKRLSYRFHLELYELAIIIIFSFKYDSLLLVHVYRKKVLSESFSQKRLYLGSSLVDQLGENELLYICDVAANEENHTRCYPYHSCCTTPWSHAP